MQLISLELYTAKLSEQLAFYRNVLFCNVAEQADSFIIYAGATELLFRSIDDAAPTYHFAFTIPENKFDEALGWISSKAALIEVAPGQVVADFKNWDAKAFYFSDPAGNIVEFIARRPLSIVSELSFNGASLASVSEIGIVTDDVPLACRQLAEIWNVPLFTKQPPSANFAAAGNDEGLFIVVSEGRPWFPTDVPAIKAPLTAVFQSSDGLTRKLEFT